MDGLLLDSERQMYIRIGMEVSRELGKPLSQEFFASLMGGSWVTYPQKVAASYEDFPIDEFMRRYWEKVDGVVYHEAIPFRPGAIEILEECRKLDIPMAVATSTYFDKTMACLRNAKIDHYFDFVITGDMVERSKPDPEIFLKAIEHFDVPKEEALVFEDGHNGAQAAIRGEIPLIIVQDLAQLTDEDRQKAVMVTDDLRKAIPYIRKEHERTAGIQAETAES